MYRYTFDEINASTGFANGDKFTSAQQVCDYFTPQSQREMFGDEAVVSEPTLKHYADTVLFNKWHCDF